MLLDLLLGTLTFNSVFNFIDTTNTLLVRFQLILIVHDIYYAFDANPSLEGRGVFLDMSINFDRV